MKAMFASPVDSKEIKPVNPKGNQPWIFIGRTDAEAEAPMLWPPDMKIQLLEKTLMLGKTEGRRRRGWQQRMRWLVRCHNGHECEQTLGDSEGQGSLACCSPWNRRVRHDLVNNICHTWCVSSVSCFHVLMEQISSSVLPFSQQGVKVTPPASETLATS